jgi:hypothetical protein
MNPAPQALVCSFGDAGAGVAGLAWDLGEPGALLLSDGQISRGSFALEEGGDAATLEISAATTIECTLSPRTAAIPLSPTGISTALEVSVCQAEVSSGGRTISCPGQIDRWSADPRAGAGTFRRIAVEAGEEALLVAIGRGDPGAPGHGEEAASAWRIEGESAIAFEEALISTEYDGEGRPTRFGLELWPPDADQSSRAAATRVSATSLGGVESGGTAAAVFRCHADGFEGLGSYLLWRA